MDYGKVEIAISANFKDTDLFGSVVNDCSKMSSTVPNLVVISIFSVQNISK